MKKLLTIIALACSLQGCIFVVGAAAGLATATAVYDHRKIETVAADTKITNTIAYNLSNLEGYRDTHIVVATINQTVLLVGQAATPEYRQQAEQVAHDTAGVKQVYNQITIQGPTSPLTRTSDSWITTKIKTQMLAMKDLESGTIKVLTENGTVYLMGSVTHEQADKAVAIARKVSGVQRVMKIFQYPSN